jgi:hypothetical protein
MASSQTSLSSSPSTSTSPASSLSREPPTSPASGSTTPPSSPPDITLDSSLILDEEPSRGRPKRRGTQENSRQPLRPVSQISRRSPSGHREGHQTTSSDETPAVQERLFVPLQSVAADEWNRQKQNGAENEAIDDLMKLVGLEEVKQMFLDIKAKVDICIQQGISPAEERYNIVFQGNPGTGE